MGDNYSLADIAAATGNEGMRGDGLWLIFLFALIFGFGGNGFGNNGNNATAAAQQEILYGQQFQGIQAKLNEVGNGICNSTYDLNNSIKDCCCNTQLGIQALGAQVNDQTCHITTAIHAEGEATRALIRENEIQTLRDKVTDLQLRASQCDQNAAIIGALRPCPTPAYLAPNPYCNYNNQCCNNI